MAITYEYHCNECEEDFTAEQSILDEPLDQCALCGSEKVFRMISQDGGFILRGDGWFSDLYSKPQKTNKNNKNDKEK